jgi:hypothetical protein
MPGQREAVTHAEGIPLPFAIDSDLVANQKIGQIAVHACGANTRQLGIYRLVDFCVNDKAPKKGRRFGESSIGRALSRGLRQKYDTNAVPANLLH